MYISLSLIQETEKDRKKGKMREREREREREGGRERGGIGWMRRRQGD